MERIHSLILILSNLHLDGILVSNTSNVSYLSSFTGESSILFIIKDQAVLITDQRYFEQAQNECPNLKVMLWINNIRYGFKTYQFLIDKYNVKKLGIEGENLTLSTYDYLRNNLINVELKITKSLIEQKRLIKDETEIENLKTACKMTDQALQVTLPKIKPGMSEIEIAARLEYNIRTGGADNISFETLLQTGKRTSLLHGKPSNRKISKGDFLLFDFGALVHGYHADVSRTLIVGETSDKQKELYSIIYECQQTIVHEIKNEVHISHINKIINNIIPDKYKEYLYHGYGHGVGLDIHEEPFLKLNADFVFQKGMVVTVEPGIYIPHWGGLRIEDTILVKEKNSETLSNFSRELIIIN
ncbi:MAG: aminopeptidase P family protein [Bacteroidales bacterium]|nr:aminopeptidase P family protein [Bacteroidales bacterium]